MQNEDSILDQAVVSDTELKTWLVNYVGNKANPDNGEVTVEHIVEVMADEFPEFLMAIAEENWIRGYEQALNDVDMGERLAKEQAEFNEVDTNISQ